MKLFKTYLSYLKDNPQKFWFKAKWYGWGWTPVTWEGWLVTGVYIGLILFLGSFIDKNYTNDGNPFIPVLSLILLTVIFIFVAYKKGEKPGWRWGRPKLK